MSIAIGISNAIGMAQSSPAAYSNLYSVEFDGTDDYLTSASVPSIGTGDFSVSFWIYRIADSGADEYIMFSDAATDWSIFIRGTDDKIKFQGSWADLATGTVSTGAWEHWVFTVDRDDKSKWYKNGSFLDQKTISDTTNFSTTPVAFTIGRDNGSTYNLNSRLDEVSIWNVALSASNVTALYNSGDPTDLAAESFTGNLINWWRMGDPSGTGSYPTIVDAKGSMRMTMTNMTSSDINTNVPS